MNLLKNISSIFRKSPARLKGSYRMTTGKGAGTDLTSLNANMACYRKMLSSNNRAIEIISDMDKRLKDGGDINYTKKAYAELRASLRECISYFNVLTHNRYFQLYPVLDTIDRNIKKALDNYAYAITGPDENGNGNANKPVENTSLLNYISPLNLVDPMIDNFTPEACRTIHDILRFIHAKSAAELAAAGHRK